MAIARPTHRKLFAMFDHAHGHLARKAGAALARTGLKPAQSMALVYLGYHNGAQISELASGIGIGNAAATGLIDRMEKAGLVIRKKQTTDARGRTVNLTMHGLSLREQVMDILRDFDDKLAAKFSESELETIHKFLVICAEKEI